MALDHRGHGRGIRSRRPFRLEDCADDAAALIDELGLGPVTAVGYSMGGPSPSCCGSAIRRWSTAWCCAPPRPASRRAGAQRPRRHPGLRSWRWPCPLLPANVRRQGMNWPSATGRPAAPAPVGHRGVGTQRSGRARPGRLGPRPFRLAPRGSARSTCRRRWWSRPWTRPSRPGASGSWPRPIPGAVAFPVAGDHRACAEQAVGSCCVCRPLRRTACRGRSATSRRAAG